MRRRYALPYLRKAYQVSERRACRVIAVCRATLKYKSVKIDVPALRARINEIAATRVRYGYPRIHILLRREGWLINRKRVYRIYREEGLSMRLKPPRRRKSIVVRSDRPTADSVIKIWSSRPKPQARFRRRCSPFAGRRTVRDRHRCVRSGRRLRAAAEPRESCCADLLEGAPPTTWIAHGTRIVVMSPPGLLTDAQMLAIRRAMSR